MCSLCVVLGTSCPSVAAPACLSLFVAIGKGVFGELGILSNMLMTYTWIEIIAICLLCFHCCAEIFFLVDEVLHAFVSASWNEVSVGKRTEAFLGVPWWLMLLGREIQSAVAGWGGKDQNASSEVVWTKHQYIFWGSNCWPSFALLKSCYCHLFERDMVVLELKKPEVVVCSSF